MKFQSEVISMNEQDKIETFFSSVRHDLRSEIMVIREGVSIILDNLFGSNCENCFTLLRHALKSTDQVNKLVGERLTSSQVTKVVQELLSKKEEELAHAKKENLKKERDLEGLKKQLVAKEEEWVQAKREGLRKDGELEKIKKLLSAKEEELKSLKRELLKKEEALAAASKHFPAEHEDLQEAKRGPSGHQLEILTYELMGMISHIIRTPLAVIKESLSLVLDEVPGSLNAKQKELLSNGKKSIDNLIGSVEELSQESWDEIIRIARKYFPAEALSEKRRWKPQRKKILIVEDQSAISNMLKMRLEANQYEVILAQDGEEGLEKARRENPSLILLDIMLPKMNGYQVCQVLKSDPQYASIPIILSSGRTPQEIKKVGKEIGADAFISKPYEAEVLLGKIRELTERHPKEEDRMKLNR